MNYMMKLSKEDYYQQKIKDILLLWQIAKKDFWIFLTKFVRTFDPHGIKKKEKVLFPAKPYLAIIAELLTTEKLLLLPKSRQMMLSWIVVAYCVWRAIFEKSLIIFFQSKKLDDAGHPKIRASLLNRALYIIDNIPKFIRPEYIIIWGNTPILTIKDTSSTIQAVSQDSDSLRSQCASIVFADELGVQEHASQAFRAIKPTLGSTGQYIGVGTARRGTFFEKLVFDEAI